MIVSGTDAKDSKEVYIEYKCCHEFLPCFQAIQMILVFIAQMNSTCISKNKAQYEDPDYEAFLATVNLDEIQHAIDEDAFYATVDLKSIENKYLKNRQACIDLTVENGLASNREESEALKPKGGEDDREFVHPLPRKPVAENNLCGCKRVSESGDSASVEGTNVLKTQTRVLKARKAAPLLSSTGSCAKMGSQQHGTIVLPGQILEDGDALPSDVIKCLGKLKPNTKFTVLGSGSFGAVVVFENDKPDHAYKISKLPLDQIIKKKDNGRTKVFHAGLVWEVYVANIAEDIIQNKKTDSGPVGRFSITLLRDDSSWAVGAALVSEAGKHFVAIRMEQANMTLHELLGDFSSLERMQEKLDLYKLQCVLKECSKLIMWMHNAGLTHRDLKPGNILLKRLQRGCVMGHLSDDVAWIEWKGDNWQLYLSDWGSATWALKSHSFSEEGSHVQVELSLEDLGKDVHLLRTRETLLPFSHYKMNRHHIHLYPGGSLGWQAPHVPRSLIVNDQMNFDKAGDMWAFGVIAFQAATLSGPNIASNPNNKEAIKTAYNVWQQKFHAASKMDMPSKFDSKSPSFASKRSTRMLAAALQSVTVEGGQSWLMLFLQQHDSSTYQWLSKEFCGDNGKYWTGLFTLMESLLQHDSLCRITAANTLNHEFFRIPVDDDVSIFAHSTSAHQH